MQPVTTLLDMFGAEFVEEGKKKVFLKFQISPNANCLCDWNSGIAQKTRHQTESHSHISTEDF